MKTFLVLCFIISVNMLVWCDAGVKLGKPRRVGLPSGPNVCAGCNRCCKKPDACCSTLSTRFDTISEKLDEVLEKVSTCFPVEPPCTEQEVVNPSFEESDGWFVGNVPAMFTSLAAFEGTRSSASCRLGAEQQFQFAAGVRTVIASVYVRVDDITPGIFPTLGCTFMDASGNTYGGMEQVTTVGDWKRIDVEVVSTQDLGNGACLLYNACTGNAGQPEAFFDVFRMFTLTETQDVSACREMFLPDHGTPK